MAQRIRRMSGAAYIETTWEELLANESVIVTAREGYGMSALPYKLPIGSKLTMAVLEPDWNSTKKTAQILHTEHASTTNHTSKGRLYVGLSNYAVPNAGVTQDSAAAANPPRYFPTMAELLPVGGAAPLNTRQEYKHMQPSLTATHGRAFGDLATPLWIDAWQSDTIGIFPDPDRKVWDVSSKAWVSEPKCVPAHISFLFYKFNEDFALQRIMGLEDGTDPAQDAKFFKGPLKLKIYLEFIATPWETWA